MTTAQDHLDAANDAVADFGKRSTKKSAEALLAYCKEHDLDPDGYSLAYDDAIGWTVDEADDEPEQTYSSKMAKALAEARPKYIKSKASSGKSSLHNGDGLATLLAGCEPEEVCQLADLVCEEPAGTHHEKYGHLNQGQQRMNAGNKVRGRIKRGEILEATVIEVAKANLATLKGA